MKPTVEWIKEKYILFNNQFFGNYLEMPILKTETITANKGQILGQFSINPNKTIKAKRNNMHMFYYDYYLDKDVYVNHDNFIQIMNPSITLNALWDAEEIYWETTLLHEMCHYRTYIDGYCPKKPHCGEFVQWADYITIASNNKYKITTYCDCYTEGRTMDDSIITKNAKNLCGIYVKFIDFGNEGNIDNRFYLVKNSFKDKFIEQLSLIFTRRNFEIIICSDPNWAKEMVSTTNLTKTQRTVWTYYDTSAERTKKAIELMNNYPTEKKVVHAQTSNIVKERTMFSDIIKEVFNELAQENDVVNILPGKNLSIEIPFE